MRLGAKEMKQLLAIGLLGLSAPAFAQDLPLPVSLPQAQPGVVLPANTELTLSMNQEVTTKGKKWSEGDTFDMSVTHDVMLGQFVVIPKGSRGVGRITFLTSKGAFGKSGKMDIELEYVEVGGRRIPIAGSFKQEGEGNTVATIGGVLLAGVFAGFVTGKSGRIPQGRELAAHTKSDLPVALPAGMALTAPAIQAVAVQPASISVAPPAPAAASEGAATPSN